MTFTDPISKIVAAHPPPAKGIETSNSRGLIMQTRTSVKRVTERRLETANVDP